MKPYRDQLSGQIHEKRFWLFWDRRESFFEKLNSSKDILVCSGTAKYIGLVFVKSGIVLSQKLKVFSFQDFANFAVLQSSYHDLWARRQSSTLGETLSYSNSDAFLSYPRPSNDSLVVELEILGEQYNSCRREIMLGRNEGLTKIYNRFHNPQETSADIAELRRLHVKMDQAVSAAYGWRSLELGHGFHDTKQGIRYTICETARREVLDRLLKLNHQRYAEEVDAGLHGKKTKADKMSARKSKKILPVNPTQGDWITAEADK